MRQLQMDGGFEVTYWALKSCPFYSVEPRSLTRTKKRNFDKRIDALSVFITNFEEDEKKERDLIFDFGNAEKKFINSVCSFENNQVCPESKNIFTRKGNKLLFNFRHFLNPEEVAEAYLDAKSYDSVCVLLILAGNLNTSELFNLISNPSRIQSRRFNKKKLLAAVGSKSNIEIKANLISTEVDTEKKLAYGDKSGAWATKTKNHARSKKNDRIQRVKRVSATKNFVYDFENPLNSMSVLEPTQKLFSTSSVIGSNFLEKRRSAATLPHLIPASSNKNSFKSEEFNYNSSKGPSLPSLQNRKETSSNSNFRSVSKSRYDEEKIARTSSSEECSLESSWQKLRQRTSNKLLRDKTEASNARLKKLYETFEKLNKRLDDCKLQKKNFSLPKGDEIDEKTYRIREDFSESTKLKENRRKEDFENLKRRRSQKSDVEDYLDKYALSLDKLKDEDSKIKEIHPSTKEVEELFERLNIRDIGFQEVDDPKDFGDFEKNAEFTKSKAVNQESQFTNRLSLEEKEKIIKRLLSGKPEQATNIEGNKNDFYSGSQQLKKEESKPQIPNIMSRIFKSDYLKQDFNL